MIKILVFEYVCGGGFQESSPPEGLLRQGREMLVAVLEDFAALSQTVSVYTVLEHRWAFDVPAHLRIVSAQEVWHEVCHEQLRHCDAALMIAPETGRLLEALCAEVQREGKLSLNCSTDAICLCADKLALCRHLQAHGIASVESRSVRRGETVLSAGVIKPRDGAGCEDTFRIVAMQPVPDSLDAAVQWIWQPWCEGMPVSLSLLFAASKVELLSLNRQLCVERDGALSTPSVDVGVLDEDASLHAMAEDLMTRLQKLLPGLRGYVGVDAIWDGETLKVLEINPRITLAYAGLERNPSNISLGSALLQAHDLGRALA